MSKPYVVKATGPRPGQRQRADGTWTYTTEEWDATWYWPVGTRVRMRPNVGRGLAGATGTVVKKNPVSVRVQFDDASKQFDGVIYFEALERL